MKKNILLFVTIIYVFLSASFSSACTVEQSLNTLALNIYFEARGDGKEAMQMVGEVTLNRVESPNYPNSICAVVYQPDQFSWTNDKDKIPHEKEAWEESLVMARELLNGTMIRYNNGATHFVSHHAKWQKWMAQFEKIGTFGTQTFYADGSV